MKTNTKPQGKAIETMLGRAARWGWIAPPVIYESGIFFDVDHEMKTIYRERNGRGVNYAPERHYLPFTTTGTWDGIDEYKFYPVAIGAIKPQAKPETEQKNLSQGETEAITLIAKGLTRIQTAEILGTTASGIRGRLKECCKKLGASTSEEAVYYATKKGIIK